MYYGICPSMENFMSILDKLIVKRLVSKGCCSQSAVLDLTLVRHWQKRDNGKVKGPWKEDGKGQKTDVHE